MRTVDVLDKGHLMVMQTIDDLPEVRWDEPGVCGNWSVKEIIAHLTSYELLLIEAFKTFSGAKPDSSLLNFAQDNQRFHAAEVAKRRYATAQQIADEYNDVQVQAISLLAQVAPEKVTQKGIVPWFGPELALSEVVDQLCAHTCEHCEHIKNFRERSHNGSIPEYV
jgi:hypothetical protein